jgi:Cof subfamily protein (haloacid dehalogenase superfamily)
MIKLLALDLDGTLLDSTGSIPDENRNAIREAENAGVLVKIATRRRFRDARPLGLEIELNSPLVTHNGALLKFAHSLETVSAKLLDQETTQEVVRVGKKYGGDALVSTDPNGIGTMLYDRVSDDNLPLKKYLRWAENLHGGTAGRDGVEHVTDLEDVLDDHEVVHISFSGGCDAMSAMLSFLNTELGNSVTILPTIYAHMDFTLIDILPPNTTKGTGLETLAAIDGIGRENVMAIGDNFNDLGMLEFAGTPVVMGNADAELLERAEFFKTDTNNNSGVAAAIRSFILEKET